MQLVNPSDEYVPAGVSLCLEGRVDALVVIEVMLDCSLETLIAKNSIGQSFQTFVGALRLQPPHCNCKTEIHNQAVAVGMSRKGGAALNLDWLNTNSKTCPLLKGAQ